MFQINFEEDKKLNTEFQQVETFETNLVESTNNLINDYNELINRPSIEKKMLEGDMTLEDIGVNEITNTELEMMLK